MAAAIPAFGEVAKHMQHQAPTFAQIARHGAPTRSGRHIVLFPVYVDDQDWLPSGDDFNIISNGGQYNNLLMVYNPLGANQNCAMRWSR